ncbi:MAG: methylmalonyl-CoA mutase [Crocinitomix sp.]|jgi:methylmalonyl-CoA mutase
MSINEIFKDFTSSSSAEWMEKIKTDLKGKPLAVLASKPEPDLEIVAYHHGENLGEKLNNGLSRNLSKPDNSWKIRQEFTDNTKLLKALNEGVDAIGLKLDHETNFDLLTGGVAFEHIESDIIFSDKAIALNANIPLNSVVNFDVIGKNLALGKWQFELEDYLAVYQKHAQNKSIWISGAQFGMAGASTLQELAFTIAHVNEYVQFLNDKGYPLAEINDKLVVELSVNENYFVNIAKFRVIKDLIQLVFKGYDPAYKITNPVIYAKTNLRHLAKNDKNNNPLRETTQAMSAVIGGCDVLTVTYGQHGTAQEVERFERIAKNIQLVLKEEAYLDKVVDPSGGSYTIEAISEQLLTKSWALFQEIEANGGLIASVRNNSVQDKIAANQQQLIADLIDNKRTFLGVNKHPNATEQWINVSPENTLENVDFKPLLPFYLENHFPNN